MNLSVLGKHLTIVVQEARMGETAFGVACLGPRIAEVQIDAGNLVIGKQLGQLGSVKLDKGQIRNRLVLCPLQGAQHDLRFQLDSNEINIRVTLCQCINEASFSTADLHVDRIVISEAFFPASFIGKGLSTNVGYSRRAASAPGMLRSRMMCLLKTNSFYFTLTPAGCKHREGRVERIQFLPSENRGNRNFLQEELGHKSHVMREVDAWHWIQLVKLRGTFWQENKLKI